MRRTTLVVAVVAMLVFAGCVGGNGFTDSIDGGDGDGSGDESTGLAPDGDLEIHHLDVGQADSTLIVTPAGESILIDTGDWRADGAGVIDSLEERGIDRIDHLVATHPHADHIGGHAAVIEHFETDGEGVGVAYDPGVVHDSATFENYLDAIEAHDVDLFEVRAGDELLLADDAVSATVLNPTEGESATDLNEASVALAIEYGDVRYLTTGDAETDVESRLVDDHGADLAADAVQAGHHGSSTSSSKPFLEAVDPDLAVISSALDSQYGHPHEEVLERFADRGIETYWTAVHGDVVLVTDGETIEVETAESYSSDPEDLLEANPDTDASPHVPTAAPSSTVVGSQSIVPVATGAAAG
ncbi:ComEC/Rec2 family competence protein [Halopiger goleimassiliensis]|uniref:ComEC/Rec2 family competence protein n=1 Tax=Halopiger goleimassiliensis TaxID=1293048 RepID=UPI0006777D51|nr:ComEC/Rec2 family competence protein [Halopiger goleimassiliensis]